MPMIASSFVFTDIPSSGGGGGGLTPTNPTRATIGQRFLQPDGSNGIWLPDAGRDQAFSGAKSGGNVTVSSSQTLSGALFCKNLTLGAGVELNTGGYPIIVDGTITFGSGSKITRNGANASGGTGGSGYPQTFYYASGSGGNGGTSNGSGSGGAFPCTAARGGNGGTGTVGFGGSSGSALNPFASDLGALASNTLWFFLTGRTVSGYAGLSGGTGGGGAGGSGAASGGGGGAGGGIICIICRTWSGNGSIEAKGGDGANGLDASSAGGGGGGGGIIYFFNEADIATQTYQAGSTSGGTGGGHANVPRQRTLVLADGSTLVLDVSGGQGGTGHQNGSRGDPGLIIPTEQ